MRPMGQLVGVVEKPSTAPGVIRFELNRSLSGMGPERFASAHDAVGPRPSAALARALFETGKVESVHVFSNIVTVDIAKDTKLERTVALKFLPKHVSANHEQRKRFEIEAKAAASGIGDFESGNFLEADELRTLRGDKGD